MESKCTMDDIDYRNRIVFEATYGLNTITLLIRDIYPWGVYSRKKLKDRITQFTDGDDYKFYLSNLWTM